MRHVPDFYPRLFDFTELLAELQTEAKISAHRQHDVDDGIEDQVDLRLRVPART